MKMRSVIEEIQSPEGDYMGRLVTIKSWFSRFSKKFPVYAENNYLEVEEVYSGVRARERVAGMGVSGLKFTLSGLEANIDRISVDINSTPFCFNPGNFPKKVLFEKKYFPNPN